MALKGITKEDMVEGGVFLADTDVEIRDIKWTEFDYTDRAGNVVNTAIGLLVDFDAGEAESQQFYSAGSNWQCVEDGLPVEKENASNALRKDSNAGIFLQSLEDQGVPLGVMQRNDVRAFIGLKLHLVSVPAPKVAGRERDRTILVASKLYEPFPWATETPATAGQEDVKEEAASIVMELVLESGGELTKKDLIGKVMGKTAGMKKAKQLAIVRLITRSDTFLKERSEWDYEGGTLRIG